MLEWVLLTWKLLRSLYHDPCDHEWSVIPSFPQKIWQWQLFCFKFHLWELWDKFQSRTKIFRQIVYSPKNAGWLKLFGSLDWIQRIVSAKQCGGVKRNSENVKHFVLTLSKLQNFSFIFFFSVKAFEQAGSVIKKEEKRTMTHKKNLDCVTLGSFSAWPFPVCARKPPNENELYHGE